MERDFYNKEKEENSEKRRMMVSIIVGNLSSDVREETIREAFESFGVKN